MRIKQNKLKKKEPKKNTQETYINQRYRGLHTQKFLNNTKPETIIYRQKTVKKLYIPETKNLQKCH